MSRKAESRTKPFEEVLVMQDVRSVLALAAAMAIVTFSSAHAASRSPTLKKILAEKKLKCGVAGNLAGFSYVDSSGAYRGLDADYCNALGAAIGVEVSFKALNAKTRFPALESGEVDVLVRNTTFTFTRDVNLGFDFVGINYYDGQGFMVPKAAGVKSVKELGGASICVQTGTTTELNLNDAFARMGLKFKSVVFETLEDATKAYEAGRCDAYTTDASGLAASRTAMKKPGDHIILKEVISKEPLGPLVRHGDNEWGDVVRWVFFALITAEEKGITQANVAAQAQSTKDPEVARMLGKSSNLGEALGLSKDWALKAIAKSGNSAEIFERNLGPKTPLALERGLNQLWSAGGLLYSAPFN
jgi:general L-amino acid transport system substrate-binding protein